MRRLLRYLTRIDRRAHLPRMRRTLRQDWDRREVSADEELLIMTGTVSDPASARELLAELGAERAPEVLDELHPRPRANWRRRLRSVLARFEGGYLNDPLQWERDHREKKEDIW